jgi:uncharacterized protein (DUF608 family)
MKISRRSWLLGSAAALGVTPRSWSATSAGAGRKFTGESLREIAFPLGGIGTGTVSLGGYGNLRDWEIFNRPNKGATLPYTFAALRIAGDGLKQPTARVLEREPLPPYTAALGLPRGIGLPRFREVMFTGAYPFAWLTFEDPEWPVEVSLEAFNPMVPLDTAISSLPVAILIYTIRSRATAPIDASLAFSLMNPVGYDHLLKPAHRRAACFGQNLNEFRRHGGVSGLFMSSAKYDPDSFRHGTVSLATDATDVSWRLQWEHGALWDDLPAWWRDFMGTGRLPNDSPKITDDGFSEYASLAAHFRVQPAESRRTAFVLAWGFPNIEDYWTGLKPYFISQKVSPTRRMRNQYGTQWKSAWDPAVHTVQNLKLLREKTLRYHDTLYGSTMPPELLDAVSTQVSTIRTNTVMVEEGGRVLAFEGCADDQGSCPMNCTHVYNYEQSIAHLYPQLERSMRETDFLFNVRDDGYMSFRTATPVQHGAYTKHAAADGQMGSILKLYREWMLGAEDAWLRKLWPNAKKALEFAWMAWDKDRDGVMEGEQHNTYDVRFSGPSSMTGTLYLGALAAGARIARHLGDADSAERYETILQNGRRQLERLLWNGEYYVQKPEPGKTYQYGEGCLSDQLVGQWFAEIVNLGKLLPHDHIRQALRAVYRNNFRTSFRDFPSGQRVYALNDEAGLVVCTWPNGGRPAVPFGYVDEVWTGVEYEVAAHLIYEGMVTEALRLVQAVRQRHNGARRNPWDELEAGHHYARAMSSWSLLTAYSGFAWSAPAKALRFKPAAAAEKFCCFFCTGRAWGRYEQVTSTQGRKVDVRVEGGELELVTLRVPAHGSCRLAWADDKERAPAPRCRQEGDYAVISFAKPLRVTEGKSLTFTIT